MRSILSKKTGNGYAAFPVTSKLGAKRRSLRSADTGNMHIWLMVKTEKKKEKGYDPLPKGAYSPTSVIASPTQVGRGNLWR